MLAAEKLIRQGVEDGIFPYAEWAVFDMSGVRARGATEGPGGRYFDLASLTKTFTSTAILTLFREGRLSLDSSAGEILGQDYLLDISVFSLLTHTSGLPAWYPFYADGRPFFEALGALLAERGRGSGMVYSDLGYMLLGLILSRVTEKHLEDAADPLGFGAVYRPDKALELVPSCRDNAVEEDMCRELDMGFSGFRPHFTDVIGEPNDGNAHYYWHDVSGHAGLFGTVDNVAALGRFYLSTDDPFYLGGVTPQAGCEGRCLTFHTGGAFPTGCGHTGFTGTSLWLDRDRNIGLALLTNRLCYDHKPTADMNSFRRSVHEALTENY